VLMTLQRRVERILKTRLGSRPGNPRYGSRVYLLRDRRVDDHWRVLFAKYCHEDIVRSDPELEVEEARIVSVSDAGEIRARIVIKDSGSLEVKL
jgi:phage baseplate assembly protein W